MRKIVIIGFIIFTSIATEAQVFCGEHKYDGSHKNEVSGYFQGGSNTVTGKFFGPSVAYTRHFTDRLSAEGAFDAPIGKAKIGVSAKGSYRFPLSYFNFYLHGKLMYNRYSDFHTNEYTGNLSVLWEAPYFDVLLGESLINYRLLGSSYTEPLTFTFGTGVNIRPRWNSWNIGLFFRNYDDFYYENWNINWGVRWNANINSSMRLFGELNVRPAGSMSQLATKYETSMKIGMKYVW